MRERDSQLADTLWRVMETWRSSRLPRADDRRMHTLHTEPSGPRQTSLKLLCVIPWHGRPSTECSRSPEREREREGGRAGGEENEGGKRGEKKKEAHKQAASECQLLLLLLLFLLPPLPSPPPLDLPPPRTPVACVCLSATPPDRHIPKQTHGYPGTDTQTPGSTSPCQASW